MTGTLASDEVIELGQEPAADARTELEEIRAVVDDWIVRYNKEVSKLIARQSRLARETGAGVFRLWLEEVGATLGVVPHPAEVWEATRLVAYKLLDTASDFARQFHRFITDDQDRLLTMGMDQALSAIDTAEQFASALRPEILEFARRFVAAATEILIEVAEALAEIIRNLALGVREAAALPFDLLRWLRDHIGTVVLVGAGVLVAGLVLPPLLSAALAPSPSGRAA